MTTTIIVTEMVIAENNHIRVTLFCAELKDTATVDIDFEQLSPFAAVADPRAVDLFFISAVVYGVDRFIERHSYAVDGWSRELQVTFPVYALKSWKALEDELGQVLSFLTGDYWNVKFKKNILVLPTTTLTAEYQFRFTQVQLFSSGLDSLIGAIDFLKSNQRKKILLVSHYDSHMSAGPEQKSLLKELVKKYPSSFRFIPSVGVSPSYKGRSEKTFRSRSLLFLGIAALAGNYQQLPIIVPENGTVSLNYPLSSSRRSACSTRTTHPTFIDGINGLLAALGLAVSIINPYHLSTKGEMVSACKDRDFLLEIVGLSKSCGKSGHKVHWTDHSSGVDHCGVCMPCIYRQASMQNFNDPTNYGNSINKTHSGKKIFLQSTQGEDFNACLEFLAKSHDSLDIRSELMVNGIRNITLLDNYISLVKRSKQEVSSWVQKEGNAMIKNKGHII